MTCIYLLADRMLCKFYYYISVSQSRWFIQYIFFVSLNVRSDVCSLTPVHKTVVIKLEWKKQKHSLPLSICLFLYIYLYMYILISYAPDNKLSAPYPIFVNCFAVHKKGEPFEPFFVRIPNRIKIFLKKCRPSTILEQSKTATC